MSEGKELFVLVVESDRVVAATLAGVLHAGGYMAATTSSPVAALRIASRMVIDAAVITASGDSLIDTQTASALQNKYPHCRILFVCAPAQVQETRLAAEEEGLACEFVVRPLSRAELLTKLAAAQGLSAEIKTFSGRQLQAA